MTEFSERERERYFVCVTGVGVTKVLRRRRGIDDVVLNINILYNTCFIFSSSLDLRTTVL